MKNTAEEFLECLTTRIAPSAFTNEQIILTLHDPTFSDLLNTSINNQRFLFPSTPKPFALITPTHVSHIQTTVYCAKKHGVQIRIRSGGHDYEGLSIVSYTPVPYVVIDLKNLSSISVDVEGKTAWVQTGATLGELYYRIAEKSETLAFPAGDCHTVGLGGQIGGGGYGYLTRKYGLAADNAIDAEFIDVEGRILNRKSMGEDLFWAIRGGGASSFGIVTAWKLRLVDVPAKVTVFDIGRPMHLEATKKFVHKWQRRSHKLDEDLATFLRFLTVGSVDEEGNKRAMVIANLRAVFHGGVDRLLELMEKEYPEIGLQRKDCIEMKWVESFLFHNYFRKGEPVEVLLNRKTNFKEASFKAKSDHVTEPIPDEALEGMLKLLLEEDIGGVLIDLFPYGGIMDEISESELPFPHRAGNIFAIHYFVVWDKHDGKTEQHLSWARKLYKYMTPYVSKNPRATYLNFRDLDIGINEDDGETTSTCDNVQQPSIWGPKYFKNNFEKLIKVKTSVDPTNFFTNEQSIPPLLSN